MQLALSMAIMQVPTSVAIMQVLMFYCDYIGGTFCDTYVMLVNIFVAVMKVTVSDAIMQLEVSATLMPLKISAVNMWVIIFIEIMQVGESVAIMQVVFSTVHYAHDYVYCNYAGGCFRCSHVCNSFKQQIYIPFSN